MNDKLKGISKNDNMKVFNIPLFRIAHTRKEWQKNFSPLSDKDKVELLDSIRREGLLHPIIVWEKEKEDAGVFEDLIRVSVGIEDIEDLKADFAQAIEKIWEL